MQQGGVVPSQTRLPPAQMMAPQMMDPQMMDPSMMDPQMMDPSMLPPGATQQVVGNLMEQEGAALTDGIMSQVDSAQDYEELMNAIRGNELPIGDRRRELAELVGAPDAEQTPDSVLTLVQPTLSLVDAQGGLDSLMQEQANIAMEDGTGAPTPMAGGLGSMLMAGQPEEPVQMAYGGLVRKMANGTPAFPDKPEGSLNPYTKIDNKDFRTMYESMLPTFMEAAGTPDKNLQKTQAYASLAGAGLRLAQGSRQPGATFLGDLAGAFQPVPGELTAIASQGSEQEAAARMQAAGLSAQMTVEQQKQLAELARAERGQNLEQEFKRRASLFSANVEFNSQESAQDQQVKMLGLTAEVERQLAMLKGSQNQDDINLTAALTKKRDELLESQKIAAGVVAFDQRAIEANVLQNHQINMQANDAASAEKNLNTEIFSREGMQLLELAQRDRALAVQKTNIDNNYKIDGLRLAQAQKQFDTSTEQNREQFGATLRQAQAQFDTTTAQRSSLAQAERDFATTMSKLTQEQKLELYQLGVLKDTALVDLEFGYKVAIANIESSAFGTGKTRTERQSAILRNEAAANSWVNGEDSETARLYEQALGERVAGRWETTADGGVVYTDTVDPLPDFLLKNIYNRFGNSGNLPDNLKKASPALDSYLNKVNRKGDNGDNGGAPGDDTESSSFYDPVYDANVKEITENSFSPANQTWSPANISTDIVSRAGQYAGNVFESSFGLPRDALSPDLVGYENFLKGLMTLVATNTDVMGQVGDITAGSRSLDTESFKNFARNIGWDEEEKRFKLQQPSELADTLLEGYVIPYKQLLMVMNDELERNPKSKNADAINTFRLITARLEASVNFLLDNEGLAPGEDQGTQKALDKFIR